MEFKGTKRNWSEAEFSDLISFSHPGMALSGRATEETMANGRLAMAAPDLLEALQAAMDYIDAIPRDIVLPAMPGFDRDWVDGVISKALGEE
ncbi:TPA: hypothetical protein ACOEP6_002487 [Enterobacter ludwigii]